MNVQRGENCWLVVGIVWKWRDWVWYWNLEQILYIYLQLYQSNTSEVFNYFYSNILSWIFRDFSYHKHRPVFLPKFRKEQYINQRNLRSRPTANYNCATKVICKNHATKASKLFSSNFFRFFVSPQIVLILIRLETIFFCNAVLYCALHM